MREKIAVMKNLESKGTRLLSRAGYLRKAIEENYPLFQKKSLAPQKSAIKRELGEDELRRERLERYRKQLGASERDELRREALQRLREDQGGKVERMSQAAVRAYENLVLEDWLRVGEKTAQRLAAEK